RLHFPGGQIGAAAIVGDFGDATDVSRKIGRQGGSQFVASREDEDCAKRLFFQMPDDPIESGRRILWQVEKIDAIHLQITAVSKCGTIKRRDAAEVDAMPGQLGPELGKEHEGSPHLWFADIGDSHRSGWGVSGWRDINPPATRFDGIHVHHYDATDD
ncbi:MAG TPA: hypothetical protein PLT27_16235, partial [Nitrospira sp.]|nr:hypothetical protein [Nitrospira sp.]